MLSSYTIPYGSGSLSFSCETNLRLLQSHNQPQRIDFSLLASQLFAALKAMVKEKSVVTIVVSDGTRNTASQIWLPVLIETLVQSGLDTHNIRFLVACGSHRPPTEPEHKRILGESIYGHFTVIDHDARDGANLVSVGRTDFGTPVEVNRLAVECDLLIITGVSSMHYFAGFGGGAKSILPGISSWESIKANHFLYFQNQHRNPLCRAANDRDNPIFLDMQQAARMLPISFMVNTTTDSKGELSGLFAGTDWEVVAADARRMVEKQYFTEPIGSQGDWVIVSSGGEPYDLNLIQAHKAIEFASYAVKPGGTILAFVQCREGIGSPQVLSYLKSSNLDEFYLLMKDDYHPHGQCAFAMQEKCERFRVILCTDLQDEIVKAFGAEKILKPQEAINRALEGFPIDALGYLIPHGHHTLPRLMR